MNQAFIGIICTLQLINISLYGQKIYFKPELKPNKIYWTTIEDETTTNVTYSGNKDFLEKLKEQGITTPIILKKKSMTKSKMQTFDLQKNKRFRMKSEILEVTSSTDSSGVNPMEGVIIYGTGTKNIQIMIDSITGTSNEELKSLLSKGMEQLTQQNIFPDKKLKPGESFEKMTPVIFPISSDKSISMELINTYRLDSITNELAYFNIDQKIRMDLSIKDQDLEVHGTGSGKIVYDLAIKNNRLYETRLEFSFVMNIKDISISFSSVTFSKTTTKVE
ncbi:MAG: hypothetical protein IPP15_00135 [Saprospiraceae bacterium]|uniref:Uncharacterized protein n=1 Tax=Candidatus Opimibacter skivensis TaxID=2982028 RepID=A0A9D7SRS3_9BACT|nr:hypothetical protein [Candidatus Opimibacter skivensis]